MLLWEVSSLNKIFKTDLFGRIRARVYGQCLIFVISAKEKVTTQITLHQSSDIIPGKLDQIKEKYELNDEKDISLAYLFECILFLAEEHQLIHYEQAVAASKWGKIGYKLSVESAEKYKQELVKLNNYFRLRTATEGYRITIADLFLFSGLFHNKALKSDNLTKYPQLRRWTVWIQELLGVDYERIKNSNKRFIDDQAKRVIELTSSKDLIQAVKKSDTKLAEKLLQEGANIESKDFSPYSILKSVSLKRPTGDSTEPKKEPKKMPLEKNILHIACENGDFPMVKLLISKGANPNSTDKDGMTPIFYAILNHSFEICEFLLENKADIEHRETQYRTPFYWAASLADLEMMEYLIKKGADVNSPSKLGRTALSKASWNGQIEIVERLHCFC